MLVWKAILALLWCAKIEAIAVLALGGNFGFFSYLSSYSHGLTWSSCMCLLKIFFPLLLSFCLQIEIISCQYEALVLQWTAKLYWRPFFLAARSQVSRVRYFKGIEGSGIITTAFCHSHKHASSMHQIFWCLVRNIVLEELTCLTGPLGLFISVLLLVRDFPDDCIDCRSCMLRIQ